MMALGYYKTVGGKQVFASAPDGGILGIKHADNVQFTVIKSWNKMRWDKKAQILTGAADLELLDRLAGLVRLPPAIEQRRSKLKAVQDAVDRERVNQNPEALYRYPVKMPLYTHQVRGANMCLLTFGWVPPERSGTA